MDNSYIKVEFVKEAGTGNLDRFSCFGLSDNPAQISFTDLEISFDSGNGSVLLPDDTNCFQQAGTYTIIIHLQDNAGNQIDKGPYEFLVKASSPSPLTSITLGNCSGNYANGVDECELSFQLKDEFENPVTQIDAANITLTSVEFTDDANTGVQFIEGLSLVSETFTLPAFELSGVLGEFSFSLTALAPSIKKVGEGVTAYFAELVDRILDFNISTKKIENDGILGTDIVFISESVSDVKFGHLFELEPAPGNFIWEGEIETPGKIELTLIDTSNEGPTTRTGILSEKNDTLTYTNNLLPYTLTSNVLEDGQETVNTHLSPDPLNGGYDPDEVISLVTEIEYVVDGSTIQYPAGGTGLDGTLGDVSHEAVIGYLETVAVTVVGADIEGGIIGNLSQMEIQPKSGIETFNISQSTEKLRDQITENVFRLSRGSSHVQNDGGVFAESWFNDTDVVIIEVVNDNVTFDSSSVIPVGNNTLIIKNGNFIVSDNMEYQNPEDSFGIILVNTDQDDRAHGNIFVHPDVRTMVGSYYADGGLMTNNRTNNGE